MCCFLRVNAFISYLLLPNAVKYEIFPFDYIHIAFETCQITLFWTKQYAENDKDIFFKVKKAAFNEKQPHFTLFIMKGGKLQTEHKNEKYQFR